MRKLKINPKFRDLCRPLNDSERAALHKDLWGHGVLSPIIVWEGKDIIVDGHNRYQWCVENDQPFPVKEIPFYDENEVIEQIAITQLGRRNLDEKARALLIGIRHEAEKSLKARFMKGKSANPGGKPKKAQEHHCDAPEEKPEKTAAKIAKEEGISTPTVERYAAFARACQDAGITEDIISGKDKRTMKEIVKAVKKATGVVESRKPHVAHNNGNQEWYTPPDIIRRARAVMGGIDTDPASSETANKTVGATTFYTAQDDGLTKPWRGKVWLNPPYSAKAVAAFAEAFIDKYDEGEFEEACILVNNATETTWFAKLLEAYDGICFLSGRVRFLDTSGEPAKTPLQGQCVIYFGPHDRAFAEAFADAGHVMRPVIDPEFEEDGAAAPDFRAPVEERFTQWWERTFGGVFAVTEYRDVRELIRQKMEGEQ